MKRILVVDRHDLFRESLVLVLERSLDIEVVGHVLSMKPAHCW